MPVYYISAYPSIPEPVDERLLPISLAFIIIFRLPRRVPLLPTCSLLYLFRARGELVFPLARIDRIIQHHTLEAVAPLHHLYFRFLNT